MDSDAQLARTVLLFQTDLGISDPAVVSRALTEPNIVIIADEAIVGTGAGQVAITTAAMLMARSGHRVFVDAPDAPLIGFQPPMKGATFYEALSNVSGEIIDGVQIALGCPLLKPHLAFVCGRLASSYPAKANRVISVGWTDWSGEICDWPGVRGCLETDWPIGAMAAAVLMASEAIKIAGRKLLGLSSYAGYLVEAFRDCDAARLELAPEQTLKVSDLGRLDIISAGAVSNALLYALLRLPDVKGNARVFDRDISDQTNRNRNMLLTSSHAALAKVDLFKQFECGLLIEPIQRHFGQDDLDGLADFVAVGVDDIPTRWLLADARSMWMGVGATTHFSSMASVHYPYSGCAACLHPRDDQQEGLVPTIAFVSFLSGLMMATDLLREISGSEAGTTSRQRYLTSLQTNEDYQAGVYPRPDCPAGCPASRLRA